ncbi:cobaltochelatase subunit CobN [Methanothermobacter thermautotrophicus]|uniref:cobaltochelatase subunit CobN n=1 Tax=Methanothermobacter thermautotrophicus TaxID=145262 RepID=UPI0022B94947|nr:cobaltochelatase subunit CobN [Methanothermobacter thermautotrophicus]WBF08748.1 cobaltochelatase subunit CobN [Methanothermobacter thermautotrophicus]
MEKFHKLLGVIILTVVIFSLTSSAYADPWCGGLKLETVKNGTVSGGLYVDTYFGTNGSADYSMNKPGNSNVVYTFRDLPANASVSWAQLHVLVYQGHMQVDYPLNVNITYNGHLLESTHLSSQYVYPENNEEASQYTQINDHIVRVTSDYLLWYDVTNITGVRNWANVTTFNCTTDGRIKVITLVVAYDIPGSTDTVAYWVNMGHDVDNYYYTDNTGENYIGRTIFGSNIIGDIKNVTATVVHASSVDGTYTFNGRRLSGNQLTGDYSGLNKWNVTAQFNPTGENLLTYDGALTGGYGGKGFYKIILALLEARYEAPVSREPELWTQSKLDGTFYKGLTYNVTALVGNAGNQDTSGVRVDFVDNGVRVGSYTIPLLRSGETTTVVFNWTPMTVGSHTLQLIIDPENHIQETNETNNKIILNVTVNQALPDLICKSTELVADLIVNETYTFTARISNIGPANASGVRVDFVDNGVRVGSYTIPLLRSGETTTIVFNWTPMTVGSHTLQLIIDPENHIQEINKTNNKFNRSCTVKKSGNVLVFIISDEGQTIVINEAAHDANVLGYAPVREKVQIQIRSCEQLTKMSDNELLQLLSACDIFLGEYLSDSASQRLQKLLSTNPGITNKTGGIFLILEPAIVYNPAYTSLMRYSNIKGEYILSNIQDELLLDYYQNTKKGANFEHVLNYISSSNITGIFSLEYNMAVLYKDINNNNAFVNQIVWALNLIGVPNTGYWKPPIWATSGEKPYGIYRHGWYNLTEYINKYFKANATGCIGLLESKMYVDNQKLQPYYAIIDALEARGFNVIPVVAYGATPEQLKVMVESFTDAPDVESFFANPSKYKVYVDAIVSMPAYGLGGDLFTNVTKFFELINVPVFKALHSDYLLAEQWELSTLGLRQLTGDRWWHIAVSESQGIIDSTIVATNSEPITDPDTGLSYSLYEIIPANIEHLADEIKGWVKLKRLSNNEKKVALIYYNYPPGKDNIGSSYLDVITSIYNLLNILKENGYTVENIPASTTILHDMIIQKGINVAPWAPGELEKLAKNAILYPVDKYMEWFSKLDEITKIQVIEGPVGYIGELCKRAVGLNYTTGMEDRIDSWYDGIISLLPENKTNVAIPVLDKIVAALKNYILTGDQRYYNEFLGYKRQFFALNISGLSGWGQPPGDIMTVEKNGTKYFVIPGMWFGNIFICPEPQRGWEGDINKLYHSMVVAPPHQYLAVYAYLQENTDAMVHLGRHATYEWLPGKEVLLASPDFPEVVTGATPQIYYYIVDGLAEGIQAKRRGSAVIIDHLTPPLTFTALYGGYASLATLVGQYDGADNSTKTEIISKIRKTIQDNNLTQLIEMAMGVSLNKLDGDKLVQTIEDYLGQVQDTLYPHGLHAIGKNWTEEEVAMLVSSILSVPFQVSTTEETTLQDEVALLFYRKSYGNLTSIQKEKVQENCIGIVKSVITDGVNATLNNLTSMPTAGLKKALELAREYAMKVYESMDAEVEALLDALNCGYIPPGAGNDLVSNPDALPTGRNFFQDQAAEIPTRSSFEYGKSLALLTLQNLNATVEKIAVGIFCTETARDDAALVSMVLALLGMEPDWSDSPSAGVGGAKLKEMPKYVELKDLVRPDGWEKKRIDVVIITTGLFRDLYSRQAGLLDKAFRVALARSYYTILDDTRLKQKYGDKIEKALNYVLGPVGFYGISDESLDYNYVAKHWVEDFEYYMSLNMTPEIAGEYAISRIFAPPENDYGAGISKSIQLSWTWDDRMELADFYLNRMGNIYSSTQWGSSNPLVFKRALNGVKTVFTSRNTNLYGVLDNDDFFDYWGGLSLAIERVNGEAPTMYVLSYGNRGSPRALTLESFMSLEATTRYFNPEWIRAMMQSDPTGRYISRKFISNLIAWTILRDSYTHDEVFSSTFYSNLWQTAYNVYLQDSLQTGVTDWLSSGNRAYAMISITGTMLNVIYMGYWKTDETITRNIANRWAKMIAEHGVACCDCSCGNLAMIEWAMQYVNPDLIERVKAKIYAATKNANFAPAEDHGEGDESGSTPRTQEGTGTGSAGSSARDSSVRSAGTTASLDEVGLQKGTGEPGKAGEGKSYEITRRGSQGFSSTGISFYAIMGVLILVVLMAIGYFRASRKDY